MNFKFRKNQRGLTLIESLISFIILAVTLLAIIQVFPVGFRSAVAAHQKTVGTFLAQAKIEQLISERYEEVITGSFNENSLASIDQDFSGYSRTTVISFVDGDLSTVSQDLGLKRIDVTVFWDTFGISRSVTLNSLITDL